MRLFSSLLFLLSSTVFAQVFTYTELMRSENQIPLGYPVPMPVDSLLPVDGYRTYRSLDLRHQQLADMSPSIQRRQVGQTLEQRPIWSYLISNFTEQTVSGANKGSAVLNGGIHAREWQSPEAATGFIEVLFNQQEDAYIHQYLIENMDLVVIPVLNIDGFLQTQRFPNQVTQSEALPRDGRMRRKNMREVDQDILTLSDNLLGVDLNRNNDPFFATDNQRSSPERDSIVHHGAVAGSEPETLALQQAAIEAGQDRLRFYVDMHSFSQIYFTPQTTNAQRNSVTRRVATSMRAANSFSYAFGPSNSGAGIGATDEYFANTFEIPSFTLEIEPGNMGGVQYGGFGVSHDGFVLPESEVTRMIAETSDATVLGLYTMAELPLLERATIRRADNQDVLFASRWVASNGAERVLEVTDNQALQPDVEYQLLLQFNKPMRRIVDGEVVPFEFLSDTIEVDVSLVGRTTEDVEWDLQGENGAWTLDDDLFERYQTDTFVLPFTLPQEFDFGAHQLLSLAVDTVDIVGQSLDANPATISDWQNGSWLGHENGDGIEDDTGGTDRSLRLVDDGSELFAAVVPPPPPPPSPVPAPQPESPSSSGGGSMNFWFYALLGLLVTRRRKSD